MKTRSSDHNENENNSKSNSDGKVEAPKTGWEGPVPSVDGGEGEKDWLTKPPYVWNSDLFKASYTSRCWCGAVEFEFVGDPIDASKYVG